MDRDEALDRLNEILAELEDLGLEAQELVREHFPNHHHRAEAYEVFNLGRSENRHNTTLATIVCDIENEERS